MKSTLLLLGAVLGSATEPTCGKDAGSAGLSVYLLGDWGGDSDANPSNKDEIGNARHMGRLAAAADNPGAVLLLGDNFYANGIHGDHSSSRFDTTFQQVFDHSVFNRLPFYAIAGNHDWRGNVSAQIEYTKHAKLRWNFPNFYYSFSLPVHRPRRANEPANAAPMDQARFIMLDTYIFSGFSHHEHDESDHGHGVRDVDPDDESIDHGTFIKPTGPASPVLANRQLLWLEQELKESAARNDRWTFVVGHYPVYSGCSHGPTAWLMTNVRPLLIKYNVSAYISGHEHCMMLITDEDVEQAGGDGINADGLGSVAHDRTKPPTAPPQSRRERLRRRERERVRKDMERKLALEASTGVTAAALADARPAKTSSPAPHRPVYPVVGAGKECCYKWYWGNVPMTAMTKFRLAQDNKQGAGGAFAVLEIDYPTDPAANATVAADGDTRASGRIVFYSSEGECLHTGHVRGRW